MENLIRTISIPKLISRAKLIILNPRTCWDTIAQENESPTTLYTHVVLPLACAGAVATVIGLQVFGFATFWGTWRPGLIASVVQQTLQVLVLCAALYGDAWVFNRLAPQFMAKISLERAFSLAAYSAVPSLVGKLLGILPPLLPIAAILGLYSFVVFFFGIRKMVEPASDYTGGTFTDRQNAFFAAAVVITIVVHVIAGTLVFPFEPSPFTNINSAVN
jgi:hypothetical protein